MWVVRYQGGDPAPRKSAQVVLLHVPPPRLGAEPRRRRGRSAVHGVDHTVERVVQVRDIREVPVKVTPKRADEWVEMLDRLTQRLDAGLLYSRDLPLLRPAMERLVTAYNRRQDGIR